MVVDIPDVVTYTNFGDHRLRGFWVAGGQISPSPTDFHCRPYNTLALPCERVIDQGCQQNVNRQWSYSSLKKFCFEFTFKNSSVIDAVKTQWQAVPCVRTGKPEAMFAKPHSRARSDTDEAIS